MPRRTTAPGLASGASIGSTAFRAARGGGRRGGPTRQLVRRDPDRAGRAGLPQPVGAGDGRRWRRRIGAPGGLHPPRRLPAPGSRRHRLRRHRQRRPRDGAGGVVPRLLPRRRGHGARRHPPARRGGAAVQRRHRGPEGRRVGAPRPAARRGTGRRQDRRLRVARRAGRARPGAARRGEGRVRGVEHLHARALRPVRRAWRVRHRHGARRRRRPLLAGPGGRRPGRGEPRRPGSPPHRREAARGRARAGERAVPLPPAGHAEDLFPAAPGAGRPPGDDRHARRDRDRPVRPALERGPGPGRGVGLEPAAVPGAAAAAQGGEVDEDRRRQRGAATPGAGQRPPHRLPPAPPARRGTGQRPWSAPATSWSRRSGRDRRGRRRCSWACWCWRSWWAPAS